MSLSLGTVGNKKPVENFNHDTQVAEGAEHASKLSLKGESPGDLENEAVATNELPAKAKEVNGETSHHTDKDLSVCLLSVIR